MKNLAEKFGFSPADLAEQEALDKRVEQAKKDVAHSDDNLECPRSWSDKKGCTCEADGFIAQAPKSICPKVDAHVHADTISYGNVDEQSVFWLDHHPSLIEFEAAKLKALWEAAPKMLEMLRAINTVIQSGGDFRLGPKGRHHWLCASLNAIIAKAEGVPQ